MCSIKRFYSMRSKNLCHKYEMGVVNYLRSQDIFQREATFVLGVKGSLRTDRVMKTEEGQQVKGTLRTKTLKHVRAGYAEDIWGMLRRN